jgi:hypothetical protein
MGKAGGTGDEEEATCLATITGTPPATVTVMVVVMVVVIAGEAKVDLGLATTA